jgi:regulator of sirC expression with transglutaminase-like and TPR domain
MTPSQELKHQLTLLYHQKEEIETEIARIELELSQSFSTNDKIEIFSKTFLQYSELKYDSQTIKNHLLGIQSINYNAKLNTKFDFLIFSIDTKYSDLVAKSTT